MRISEPRSSCGARSDVSDVRESIVINLSEISVEKNLGCPLPALVGPRQDLRPAAMGGHEWRRRAVTRLPCV